MAIKSTDRIKIQAYGDELGSTFQRINASLEELVNEVAHSNYEGANALNFKTECVNSCIAFSEQIQAAMGQMSANVEEQTTYIATALGGGGIVVPAPTGAIARPTISTDESVELADSDALNNMKTVVEGKMGEIRTSFEDNMAAFTTLGATDGWVGEEYDTLHGQMTGTTADVDSDITTSTTSINETIQGQLDALGM